MSSWRNLLLTDSRRLFHTSLSRTKELGSSSRSDFSKILLEKNLIHKHNHLPLSGASVFRCTVLSKATGVTNSTFLTRGELTTKYGLFPRDLRKIEKTRSSNTEITPSISVRKNSILMNLLNLKALVLCDEVILFDDLSLRFSYTQAEFVKELEKRLQNDTVDPVVAEAVDSRMTEHGPDEHKGESTGLENNDEFNHDDLPYELKAFEAILESVITNLTAEMKVHITVSQGIINELEQDISRDKLRFLLIQNKKISTFAQKATLIRDIIDELLDNDDDLADCYLTAKAEGHPRSVDDHAEVEMLLESYYKHSDEIVQTINHLISNVKTTEEIINIMLDSNRNQLMLLGLRFSIGLLALGGVMFTASAYGMNLENFIEETDYGFALVVVMTVIPVAMMSALSLKQLNKLEKITMMGDHYKKVK